jgi:hypothetical protein
MPTRRLLLLPLLLAAALAFAAPTGAASKAPVAGKCKAPSSKLSIVGKSKTGVVFVDDPANLPEIVAYASDEEDAAGDIGTAQVVLADLTTGKLVMRSDAYATGGDPGAEGSYSVERIALRDTGAMAWFTFGFSSVMNNAVARRGGDKGVVLDIGPDVTRGSFAQSRNGTIYWKRAGTTKGAVL